MSRNAAINVVVVGGIITGLLILNVIFYTGGADAAEDELTGDRSSYTGRTYGTRAFYTLLEESGYSVSRFREPLTSLDRTPSGTLFIVEPRFGYPVEKSEYDSLSKWIERGGRAVVFTRGIDLRLTESFEIRTGEGSFNRQIMHPFEPTPLTAGVRALRVSTYATGVRLRKGNSVAQAGDETGTVAIDAMSGRGRIIVVGDPFIIANNGITEEDNLRFAMNLVGRDPQSSGPVLFDEYHHGYGALSAGIISYFRGSPVLWILGQIACLTLLLTYSRGRRFARAIPAKVERRSSSIEFVASMANIQRLARASDLAVENIYGRLRFRLCRYARLAGSCSAEELARAISLLSSQDESKLSRLFVRAELILNGHPVRESELLSLVSDLHQLRGDLGL